MQTEIIARLTSVEKTYDSEQVKLKALSGVNLEILKGEVAILVGPSGSGKSTLLNLIGTLDRPTKGEVEITGIDITSQSDEALSRLRLASLGFAPTPMLVFPPAPPSDPLISDPPPSAPLTSRG